MGGELQIWNNHAMNSASRETTRRSEEHTSELQSQSNIVCRLLLEQKNMLISSDAEAPEVPMLSTVPTKTCAPVKKFIMHNNNHHYALLTRRVTIPFLRRQPSHVIT